MHTQRCGGASHCTCRLSRRRCLVNSPGPHGFHVAFMIGSRREFNYGGRRAELSPTGYPKNVSAVVLLKLGIILHPILCFTACSRVHCVC